MRLIGARGPDPDVTKVAGPSPVHYGQPTDSLDARTQAQSNALAAVAEIRAGVERFTRINRSATAKKCCSP